MSLAGGCPTIGEIYASLEQYKIELNSSPTISGISEDYATEGDLYYFIPNATDVNNDILTYSITNIPHWAAFDAASGAISGIPTISDIGYYSNIIITVSDGLATATLPSLSIMVYSANVIQTENSLLNDIVGYSIYMGTSHETTLQTTLDIGLGVTYNLGIMVDETYYFSIVALDTNGDNIFLTNPNINGYRVYAGTTSDTLFLVGEQISDPNTVFTISNLSIGTYYLSITTYDNNGIETSLSDIVQVQVM